MVADQVDGDYWNRDVLREVRAQLRDFTSPIELVSAGVTSDRPWLRIVFRTRGDNPELIGRILPLPPETGAADGARDGAAVLVAEAKRPLTSAQRAAITVDDSGISWVEDPTALQPDDGVPSMRFVSPAEFREL